MVNLWTPPCFSGWWELQHFLYLQPEAPAGSVAFRGPVGGGAFADRSMVVGAGLLLLRVAVVLVRVPMRSSTVGRMRSLDAEFVEEARRRVQVAEVAGRQWGRCRGRGPRRERVRRRGRNDPTFGWGGAAALLKSSAISACWSSVCRSMASGWQAQRLADALSSPQPGRANSLASASSPSSAMSRDTRC